MASLRNNVPLAASDINPHEAEGFVAKMSAAQKMQWQAQNIWQMNKALCTYIFFSGFSSKMLQLLRKHTSQDMLVR